MPAGSVKARQTGLIDRRNVRRECQADFRRDGKGLGLAAAHLRQRTGRVVNDEVKVTGHQRLHCGCCAPVRDELELGACGALEKHTAHVLGASRASRAF